MSTQEFKWKKGQYVIQVNHNYGNPIYYRKKIIRVIQRFVELEDKSKWNHFGNVYADSSYATCTIYPETEELLQSWWKQKLLQVITRIDFSVLPANRLLSIITAAVQALHEVNSKKSNKAATEIENSIKNALKNTTPNVESLVKILLK